MSLLHPGDSFPELSLALPGGRAVTVPEVFGGDFGVMLFYRGSWYSSGAIGRLVPEDVAGLIRYLREHAPAPA